MSRIALADLTDELLKDCVTQDQLDEADEFLDNLAGRLGVDPDDIVAPLALTARRLTLAYAYKLAAVDKEGQQPEMLRSGDGYDVYSQKRRFYANEVKDLSAQLTARDLTGVEVADNTLEIILVRG